MYLNKKTLILLTISAALTACGGGGGGGGSSGPVASTNTFNLQSAYTSLTSSGWSKTFTITGTCSGTIAITAGAVNTSTTFESASALSGTTVTTSSFSNCTPSSSADTETKYTDSNYIPLGYSVLGGKYAVYTATPTLPTTIRVGDTAVIGTLNRYTNNTKSTSAGTQIESFVVEADTATTAIINVVSKYYSSSNVLESTEQDRYRIDSNNRLTPISLDVSFSNGTHLIGN